MHKQSRKWLVVALVLAASLLLGLAVFADAVAGAGVLPPAQQSEGKASGGLVTDAQMNALIAAPRTEIAKHSFTKGSKLTRLTEMPTATPAEAARLESLCASSSAWKGGPTYRSATNGNAVVWGAGSAIYFAAASAPGTYSVANLRDIPWDIKFYGNTVMVFCFYNTYFFDVTDPVNPAYMYGWGQIGYAYGYNDVALTPDQNFLLACWQGWIEEYNNSIGYGIDAYNSGSGGPGFTSLIIPDDPKSNGLVAIAANVTDKYIYFLDLSGLNCDVGASFMYQYYSPDVFPLFGVQAAYLMYQAPYLYFSTTPRYIQHPWFGTPSYTSLMRVGIYQIPDLTDPLNFLIIKGYNKSGDDVVSLQPAGNGNVAVGTLQDHVFLMDAQFTTVVGFGTYGVWDPLAPPFSPCQQYMWDMGWSGTYGTVASDVRGMQSFNPASFAKTGQILTGGYSQTTLQSGNYLLVPSGTGGLVILDNSGSYPALTGQLLPSCTNGPDSVYMVAVTPDGNTAYVSDGSSTFYSINITDKANPAVVDVFSTDDGSPMTFMAYAQGRLWIATMGAHLESWDITTPAEPAYDQSVTLSAAASGKIVPLLFAAWPASTILAVVESGFVEIVDVTDPTAPYVATGGSLAVGSASNWTLAQNDRFLYLSDPGAGFLYPITITPLAPAFPVNMTMAASAGLAFTFGPTSVITEAPGIIGVYGTLAGGSRGINQYDVSGANATAPVLIPTPQFPFAPSFFTPMGDITPVGTGFAYADYLAGIGFMNVVTDFTNPVVDTPPVAVTVNILNRLQGTVNISAKVHDTGTGVQKLTFVLTASNTGTAWKTGKTIYTMASAIPAGGAPVTVSYNWDTTKFDWQNASVGQGPFYIWVVLTDGGCNTFAAVGTDPLAPYTVNEPPYHLSWTATPEPPVALDPCSSAGDWIVCGDLCFTVTADDPAANLPLGITQYIAYVDGVQYGLPSNNIPPVTFCIDTTLLTDGVHTFAFKAVDAAGLSTMGKAVSFTVHNIGPITVVTAPVSGNVVSGTAIRVAATAVTSDPAFTVTKVVFWLDDGSATPVKLGTATAPDANGEYSIAWDSTATGTNTGYGNHTIRSYAYDSGKPCTGISFSDIVSFNLVQYTPMVLTASATPTTGNIPLSVAFAANVTGGAPPFTYAWSFGDSSTGTGQAVAHTYATAGTFNWTVTVTDATAATATANGSITAINPIVPPTVTGVSKMSDPFRLKITGSNFHANCTIYIGGVAVPVTTFKSSSELVAKKGSSLKAMVPKGVPVEITVKNNDDGGVSAAFTYTR